MVLEYSKNKVRIIILKKGDLFYVPSQTLIFGKGKILKMPKPSYLINLREVDSF